MTTPMEKDIEKALGRMVSKYGGCCLKWVCPGWAGVPDRILLLPGGHAMFVELKRAPSASSSSMQVWWARKLKGLGFVHLWVRSHEDVKALEKAIRDRLPKCDTCRKKNHSYLCDGCIHDQKAVDKYEPKPPGGEA